MLQFRCSFCSFVSELSSNCKEHVINDHENWKIEIGKRSQNPKQTVHTNPSWLADLTGDFKQIIILKCSQRTRDAVDSDEIIQVFFKDWS